MWSVLQSFTDESWKYKYETSLNSWFLQTTEADNVQVQQTPLLQPHAHLPLQLHHPLLTDVSNDIILKKLVVLNISTVSDSSPDF